MGTGRRTSLTARDARADRGKGASRTATSRTKGPTRVASGRVTPLYKRLPHGPHRLEREEVVLNQRARIHGAMVEVGRTLRLRRHERQAGDRPRGRLATLVLRAVRQQGRVLPRHVRSARAARHQAPQADLPHSRGVGPRDARARRSSASPRWPAATATRSSSWCWRRSAPAPPGCLRLRQADRRVRADARTQLRRIARGRRPAHADRPRHRRRAARDRLHVPARRAHHRRAPDLAEELLSWTLLFQTPAAEGMAERMAPALTARMREISSAYGHRLGGAEAPSRGRSHARAAGDPAPGHARRLPLAQRAADSRGGQRLRRRASARCSPTSRSASWPRST